MIVPTKGIATDAAHSIKDGLTQFRAVNLFTGEMVFHRKIGNKTVNIGEFLAVVEALKYIITNDFLPPIIYTDSLTAMCWVREKRTASKKKYNELNKAEVFLKLFSEPISQIQILHWDNRIWGEIPADFGNK